MCSVFVSVCFVKYQCICIVSMYICVVCRSKALDYHSRSLFVLGIFIVFMGIKADWFGLLGLRVAFKQLFGNFFNQWREQK